MLCCEENNSCATLNSARSIKMCLMYVVAIKISTNLSLSWRSFPNKDRNMLLLLSY